jgi:hypothetical protein
MSAAGFYVVLFLLAAKGVVRGQEVAIDALGAPLLAAQTLGLSLVALDAF